jgi:hypothetical protein
MTGKLLKQFPKREHIITPGKSRGVNDSAAKV